MAPSDRIDPTVAAEIDRLATAFAKDPRSKAFMPLAESYIKANMWEEAAGVLEDGLKAYPGFVTAMAALGRVYDQLGQGIKAKAILEEVVKQSPDNLRAHRILAKIYMSEGMADVALASCAAILSVNPYDAEALSLKRSITGDPAEPATPRAKREKKRLAHQNDRDTRSKQQAVIPTPLAISVTETETRSSDSAPGPDDKTLAAVATVARLEAWLQTIQSRR